MQSGLSEKQGESLVRLARRAIERYLIDRKIVDEKTEDERLMEKSGVFVTLYRYPEKLLRGCIGFPYPMYPLWEAVKRAAIAAAVEDPRFPPLSLSELPAVVIEVSVLTVPERLDAKLEELPSLIEIGKHGLIVKRGVRSGLLLPQVATEYGWDQETFLSETCLKAGLSEDCWKKKGTEIYRFEAEIFEEVRPLGPVKRVS
jgi:hypothetical protein